MANTAFERHGPETPESPIVVSVPHAGRLYPLALHAALRVPLAALVALEDRYVDAVALTAHRRETMFVQRLPRAWIDLNRAEDERDARVDEGVKPATMPVTSPRLRAGLGLVPGRVPSAGRLWRERFTATDIADRIERDHRPYHDAVAVTLERARDRFGVAILLDLHSMPPLGPHRPRVVIGDRFGHAAASRFVGRVESAAADAALVTVRNTPYAGGHILARHGAPDRGVHAIQLELDRSLYLDARLDLPGDGLVATAALVRAILDQLTDEAIGRPTALAAE